jgi:hypothetical protein
MTAGQEGELKVVSLVLTRRGGPVGVAAALEHGLGTRLASRPCLRR